MTRLENPWLGMEPSSQRRVETGLPIDIYWQVNHLGQYGLFISDSNLFAVGEGKISLAGIDFYKVTNKRGTSLYLFLKKHDDSEIFFVLCKDIISAVKGAEKNKFIHNVEKRLRRWQVLLKQKIDFDFSFEKQMGLYSELSFLKSFVSNNYGFEQAILSWTGPDKDKQDFLLPDCTIEVKCHKSSKGRKVVISSIEQLFPIKSPFYLVSYSLNNIANGISLNDLISEIRSELDGISEECIELFETKIMGFGFGFEVKINPLYKFQIDERKIYRVEEGFPRIKINDIPEEITSVKYVIDLNKCQRFEIEENKI